MFDINFYLAEYKDDADKLLTLPWYILTENNDKTRNMDVNFDLLRKNNINSMNLENKFAAGHVIAIIEAIKNGPKVICPTFEQCLALSQVEVDLPYKLYKQTYPVLLIEFPYSFNEYCEDLCRGVNAAIIHQIGKSLCLSIMYRTRKGSPVLFAYEERENFTLEDSIKSLAKIGPNKDPKEVNLVKQIYRIAINLNLLMTNYGHEIKDWIDPKRHKKNPKPTDIQIVAVNQRIKIYERKESKDHGGTHASPHPHWRRGHWRNQPVKEGYKQVFIAPMFIGKKNFIGSLKDTYVQYTVH